MWFRSKHLGFTALSTLVVVSLLTGCGGGSSSTLSDEQRITAANTQFRSRVTTLLNNAAAEFGVGIEPDNFASIAYNTDSGVVLLVNTNIQGVNSLRLDDLRQGADVLFSFVRYADGTSGFFVTRVREENGTWVAELRTLGGQVVTNDITVTQRQGEQEKPELTVDWDDGPCIDIRWWIIVIKICIPLDLKNLIPLRMTQGGYEPQMTSAASDALSSIRSALTNRSRDSSAGVMMVSREEGLLASQLHTGVSEWTLENLSGRTMMTLFIQNTAQPTLSGRIIPVQLQNTGGVWSAPSLPGTPVMITIKQPSSPRPRHPQARLHENHLEVLSEIEDYEITLDISFQ